MRHNDIKARVVGAGLAGCEAAWQLARRGVAVELCEMKPKAMTPAHHSPDFAELVCSNSLRSDRLENAVGLLKEEMRRLGSLILSCADATRVEAGGALAVDREGFSRLVTEKIRSHPLISVVPEEVGALDLSVPTVVASGPLTSEALADAVARHFAETTGKDRAFLHFYDAAAPIVTAESVDMENAYFASRYGRGSADYINCPMSEEEYGRFYEALVGAEEAPVHGFEDAKVFEGCMPVEVMARRGREVLLYGPLKPVGLTDPRTGKGSFAVVQLRKDNAAGSLYNLVGFQTHLKFGEQQRVFSLIPALKNAEFVRFGVMHRNTFLQSPFLLGADYRQRSGPPLYFAGQMTGVEGYVESASSGLVAGLSLARELLGLERLVFPDATAIGALSAYISNPGVTELQPMNVNFGIMAPYTKADAKRDGIKLGHKRDKYRKIAASSLSLIDGLHEAAFEGTEEEDAVLKR